MPLERFVADNPGCKVVRPGRVIPTLQVGAPALGALAALIVARDGGWVALTVALGVATALATLSWSHRAELFMAYALHHNGHASFAISDEALVLVDAVGNAVIVALDRITGLEVDGDEARLRTDSELQGVVYAIMFQLFDEDIPGPTAARFFDSLAPVLRQRNPKAVIVRCTQGALYT
jgi:hypothetical protein